MLKQEASSNKSGEYIKTLAELTDKNELELIKIINNKIEKIFFTPPRNITRENNFVLHYFASR